MDDRHIDHEHAEGEDRAHSRRSFLRRVGIAGALAAGLAGGAELAGMSPAYARSQQARNRNRNRNPKQTTSRACTGCAYSCNYTPGKCGGIGPCGTGGCCFTCTGNCGTLLQCHSCSARPSYSLCIG